MTTRLSIVEDDQDTRQILADLVRDTPELELVSCYENATEALARLVADKPDLVLTDINMPGMNGIELVRNLKPKLGKTQFLMLTVYEDPTHIFAALAAGATGYLLKATRRQELLVAIQQIMEGGSPMSTGIARKVVQSFAHSEAESDSGTASEASKLSPREKTVLDLLTKGYLYKEIADSMQVSVPTVNTYIRRIYDKLQVNSRAKAVAKYLKQGE